jgi:hypothetical protein
LDETAGMGIRHGHGHGRVSRFPAVEKYRFTCIPFPLFNLLFTSLRDDISNSQAELYFPGST